jgi:N-methylhydantoinase A
VADLRHDFVRTLNRPLDAVDMGEVHGILAAQEAEGHRLIGLEEIALTAVRTEYSADMQFVGQTHLLRVALPSGVPSREALQGLFEAAYHARFRVELPTIRANLVNLNVSVIGERPKLDLSRMIDPSGRKAQAEIVSVRKVWFDRWHDTPVYWRDHLPLKISLQGPLIIEQMDTTIVIDPGALVTSDVDGNLVVEVAA